jgi:DNA-binding Lrp family transcriptional regulator
MSNIIDETDRRIIRATQEGLPLVPRPYHQVAEQLDLPAQEVMERMARMLEDGIIRRIGAVPNHYALAASQRMTVWDTGRTHHDLGAAVGALNFAPLLPAPALPAGMAVLFAMVHGRDHAELEKTRRIAALLGDADRGHEILYSTRILKKTGLRISA